MKAISVVPAVGCQPTTSASSKIFFRSYPQKSAEHLVKSPANLPGLEIGEHSNVAAELLHIEGLRSNNAFHSDAPALRDVAVRAPALQRAALGCPRSLRSLGAGERGR